MPKIIINMLICTALSIVSSILIVDGCEVKAYSDEVETYEISEEELELLYRVAYHEAYTEGDEGMRRVVDVILNRVASTKFPNTIEDVIYGKNQFKCTKKKDFLDGDVPEDVCFSVDKELNTENRLDSDSLYFAKKPITQNHVYKCGKHYFSR
jgi:N-acetylmuramoyl-L-alanine amidase